MSIIATVGRRSPVVMLLIAVMYTLLTVGGITMVYPFLLMLSTATTTPGDMQEYRVVPSYYYDDNALYRKYLWLRYDTGVATEAARDYNRAYPNAEVSEFRVDEYFGWGDPKGKASRGLAQPPNVDPNDPDVRSRAGNLDRFLKESVALWPGEPLTETVAVEEDGRSVQKRDYVKDPYGVPLDPGGLSTGVGNYYRTVGYIGAAFGGFTGPGRDQWTAFLRRFYSGPSRLNESEVQRISRVMTRHGRPYERWRQVRPGYDEPTSPSWSPIEGEYLQSDWLYYKAVWLSGAPILGSGPPGADRDAGISEHGAEVIGLDSTARDYTDVLGRTHRWTEAVSLRSLRPSQLMPEFRKGLKDRYMDVDQFNLAIGLARVNRSAGGKATITPTGRNLPLAGTVDLSRWGGAKDVVEPQWVAALRALACGTAAPGCERPASAAAGDSADYHYLLPPRIDPMWSKLTYIVGLDGNRIADLNDRIEAAWVARLRAAGCRVVHLDAFADFNEVYVSSRRPIYEPLAEEWDQFVEGKVPGAMVQSMHGPSAGKRLRLPEHGWRDFLGWLYRGREAEFRRLYLGGKSAAEVDALVARGRTLYGGQKEFDPFSLAAMPVADRDAVEFQGHKSELRRHFVFGNFGFVLDELVLEGRAMFNTIVLIVLAISAHLTVNPLAAYALSRFRLSYTYKVLLFMLATMAFPPAVGMIPSFLLLKHFGLINSYAALVLPGVASGYTIFLLKGFFDALPQELYEAAEIDGAGKIATFLNVTFPLSKPIFAIITLNTFTAAYSGFMWAFLICPDSKMWTVMVNLFNLQQISTPPIAMAALVIAAVPTFLVFLFCQNVILRGIIVPSFK